MIEPNTETHLEIRLKNLNDQLDKMILNLLNLVITNEIELANNFTINVETEVVINITTTDFI